MRWSSNIIFKRIFRPCFRNYKNYGVFYDISYTIMTNDMKIMINDMIIMINYMKVMINDIRTL